jgi:AraC-like DNA-binding protein
MDPNASWNRPSGADAVTTFASRDFDVVSERLTSISGASTRVECLGKPNAFSMSLAAAKLGCLILSKVRVTNWSLTRPMGSLTNISIPITGTPLTIRCGTRSCEVSARDHAAVGRPFEMVQAKLHEGSAMVLHAPIEALIDRAEHLTAGSFSGSPDSQMADRVDLRAPAGEAFARALKTAIVEFGALNSAGLGPLAIAGYEDLLTNLAAAALFPSITQGLGLSATQCGPATIRRARDFIKAHAAEPIKLSELAADLGLPMRTLQDNFQRHFGLSPRAWLLECRLENARQRLTLPDRPTSVSMVAYDCGFGDLSGFSAKYRKKYGEAPSQTLRIARQHFS